MSSNRPRTISRRERDGASRRSVVLLLVLIYLVLASTLLVTTTASTGQLVRTRKSEHTSILLRQLIDSARAWTAERGPTLTNTPMTLDPAPILPPEVAGTVTIRLAPGDRETMVIEAQIGLHDRRFTRTERFAAHSAS